MKPLKQQWIFFLKAFLFTFNFFILILTSVWIIFNCIATDRIDAESFSSATSSQSELSAFCSLESCSQSQSSFKSDYHTDDVSPAQNVPIILQNPELPTGCESTAASMLLHAYGYQVDKKAFSNALPKAAFETHNGRLYASHPDEAFVGNPNFRYGYGVFAKPIVKTMQYFIDNAGGHHHAKNLTGASEEIVLSYLDRGIPVCIWGTAGMLPVVNTGGWYLKTAGDYTSRYFTWPGNEHCMVLTAYTDINVTVHDPLKGIKNYDRTVFFQRYAEIGKYAVVLE